MKVLPITDTQKKYAKEVQDKLVETGIRSEIDIRAESLGKKIRDAKMEAGATLYLNMGHLVTNLSILESGVTRVVRDIFISGNTLTKSITKALGVDFAKAEELKKAHGIIVDAAEKEKALREGLREELGVSQAVTAVIKDLVGEVHRSVDFYLSQGPERSIGRIVLMERSGPCER